MEKRKHCNEMDFSRKAYTGNFNSGEIELKENVEIIVKEDCLI